MDREAWYSVTPEPIAKYLATRVSDVAKGAQFNNGDDTDMAEQRPCANVMDPFGGVGGNMIQFAIECGFCLGVDCDPAKVAFMRNNAKVYGLSEGRDFQLLQADFLSLPDPEEGFINFPEENQQFDAVFLSPPWGGPGYSLLSEYALEHVFPEFNKIVQKATRFSENLMFFLPRNTSITDLIQRLCKFQTNLLGERRRTQLQEFLVDPDEDPLELSIEVQELKYGENIIALLVYTGDLANIETKEVVRAFMDMHCQSKYQVEAHHKTQTKSSNSSMKSFNSANSGSASS